MVRIQIQLPDDVHVRAKRLAAAKELSLAELVLRGLELVLAQSPELEEIQASWRPPIITGLGWKGLGHAEIKEAAQLTTAEEELASGKPVG